jgi:hypothetical protein
VALPAVIISIGSFLLGFFIHEVARSRAELGAEKRLNETIAELQKQVLDFAQDAFAKRYEATRNLQDASEASEKVKKIQTTLAGLEAFQKTEKFVEEISSKLRVDRGFIELIAATAATSAKPWRSKEITAGECRTERLELGDAQTRRFCAVGRHYVYRHGTNKGGVHCAVRLENNQWILEALGSDYRPDCNNPAGATRVVCDAVCLQ